MSIESHPITDRASWLEMRRGDLTASDIAAIAGLDPWKSPLRVYAEKTGLVGDVEDNPAMQRGRWLELGVAAALREKYPRWHIEKATVYLRDPETRLGATPDFLVDDRDNGDGIGNIQAKIISRPAFEREWHDGRAPLRYELQTLAESMLVGASWAMVAALVIDTHSAELVECPVPRHQAAEARIRELARNFWKDVEAGRQPPVDYRMDRKVIEAMHPAGGAGPIDLTHHNRIGELCSERLTWQHRKSNAEGALEEVDAEIKAILGDHDAAFHPEFNISWRKQLRRETVLPETEFRVLRVARKKEAAK